METIMETKIEQLQIEAAFAGDSAMVAICEAALAGDADAIAECEQVIAEAAEAASDD